MEHLKSKLEELINIRLKDGRISADIAIDAMLDFFEQSKIANGDERDNDMLLFQYGITPSQEYFYFDLTRQIADLNDDEFFQIHLTLNYDPNATGTIESFNRWSIKDNTLDEFISVIKHTEGYKRVKNATARGFLIELDKT